MIPLNNFLCLNCHKFVSLGENIGTVNRNHCPYCLWSKHVDKDIPGDRKALCQNLMKPIGLIFKYEGQDKWGKLKEGELMLVHQCLSCDKISINRIAGDDIPEEIIQIITTPQNLNGMTKTILAKSQIKLLNIHNLQQIKQQLYGEKI